MSTEEQAPDSGSYGTDMIEIEEEVYATDSEAEAEVETEVETEDRELITDTPASSNAPGKVYISKAVADMKIRSPQEPSGGGSSKFPTDRNPFKTYGGWTKDELSSVSIMFPVLSAKNETTNERTRENKPEARYWKSIITFKYGTYSSPTIRFDNVLIPYSKGKGYGSSYVYMCLPGFAAEMFSNAGKKLAPTVVTEKSLVNDDMRWWKIANRVSGSFGVIAIDTKRFHDKSLETIFESTALGIRCSVILRFYCKASTEDRAPLKATTPRTVAIEVIRAYIDEIDVDVQMPNRVERGKPEVQPVATMGDVASDSLMKRLGELGL